MAHPHELDPTGRFSDRARDYVKYRPSYPAAAIDALLAGFERDGELVALDVGAGTGISARLLAERGVRVVALEPNQEMRDAAEPHPRVEWREGTAEATGLPAGAFDLVLAAQAFHWFRADEAVRELARVLRAGGRLALVWNRRSESDGFTAGYRAAILAVGGESSAERMDFDRDAVARSGLFGPLRLQRFQHQQRLDRDGLLGRALSASYVPKTGEANAELRRQLAALHARHADADGCVTLVYETEVHTAERL